MANKPINLPPAGEVSRRTLLEWLGTGTVLALGGSTLTSCLSASTGGSAGDDDVGGGDNPGGDARLTGDRGPASCPFSPGDASTELWQEFTEYTIDPQSLASLLASWELTVDGMVEEPQIFTFADLVNDLTPFDPVVDFHCVTGWSVYDVPWNGVHLSTLFDRVVPTGSATHVTLHTVGGTYNESLPLDVALEPNTLLAYGVDGNTIPLKHGFPLRLVVPRLQAYKSAKYVYRVELTDAPVLGFWEQRGYPYDAEVPANRLRDGKY